MTENNYEAIVIGIGGMGSATVYHLAKRGLKVLGIEQISIPHDMGSSHGLTRIIRLAYYEDPSYVPLLHRAYELWDELEQESGEKLLHITGSIDAGTEDSDVFAGSVASCIEHNLEYDVLTSKELTKRFPGYRFPAETMALFQPQGGLLVPELCIQAHVEIAKQHGATIHTGERVQGWDILAVEEGRYYGFPEFNPQGNTPGMKYGRWHHREEIVDPDEVDRDVYDADEKLLRQFGERYFPEGAGKTLDMKVCMFTNTHDEHWILDTLPDAPQVSIAAGFSGHGFKMASVIGEIMADLAQHGETKHTITLHQLNRRKAYHVHSI